MSWHIQSNKINLHLISEIKLNTDNETGEFVIDILCNIDYDATVTTKIDKNNNELAPYLEVSSFTYSYAPPDIEVKIIGPFAPVIDQNITDYVRYDISDRLLKSSF